MNESQRAKEFLTAVRKKLSKNISVSEQVWNAQSGSLNLQFTKWESALKVDRVDFMYDSKRKLARQVKNLSDYVKNFFEGVKILDRVDAKWTAASLPGNWDEFVPAAQEHKEIKKPKVTFKHV